MAPLKASLSLLLVATVLLPGGEAADEGASARVAPSVTVPGRTVELIFSVESPDLLEVVVAGRIVCTVTLPNGVSSSPCSRPGALVDVRLVGSGQREYVFAYIVPAVLGRYAVHFEAQSLLTLLPATYTADTSFRAVAEAGDGGGGEGDGGDGGGDGGGGGGGTTPTPGPSGSPAPTDDRGGLLGGDGPILSGLSALRWLVSSLAAAAVLTVTMVGLRRPGGSA